MHWWTKIYYKACDLKNMTAKCLTKVNTMINRILTSSADKLKQKDGKTQMTQIEIDQCLAELCYLKRAIDTQI